MVLQTLFIGKFYLSEKTNNFKKNFASFSANYNQYVKNGRDLSELFLDYETKNNTMVATYDLYTRNIGTGLDTSQDLSQREIDAFDRKKLLSINSAIDDWLQHANLAFDVIYNRKTIMFSSTLNTPSTKNLVSVAPIIENNKVYGVLISITSLQPISEASTVIKHFYVYFYILAIFIIFLLSYLYTNMIAKPLKKLNKTATSMANMDFSARCKVTSSDEIGNLASTLNFLSENLGKSLNELQEANEKLKEDIEKEKHLEVMRREFVAGVSHELKTPISLISGYAEGLKDNVTNGKKIDYYTDVIIDEADKMSVLVSDMLDLSQLETGNFKLYIDEFYIDKFISYFVDKHRNQLTSKNINIETLVTFNNILVSGDRFRIEQVMNNLLNNAVKYTPEGGTIKINTSLLEDDVLIEVENPGEHIPEDEIQNIWDKFYKVDKSRNRNLGGTGLGLSIVKNILSLHDSKFGVKNMDVGVNFYFTLKISKDE